MVVSEGPAIRTRWKAAKLRKQLRKLRKQLRKLRKLRKHIVVTIIDSDLLLLLLLPITEWTLNRALYSVAWGRWWWWWWISLMLCRFAFITQPAVREEWFICWENPSHSHSLLLKMQGWNCIYIIKVNRSPHVSASPRRLHYNPHNLEPYISRRK